nr:A24 family peptidase [Hyphomonas sp. Mor2]
MTRDAAEGSVDPYPDVRMGARFALILAAGLTVSYAVIFLVLATPGRSVGMGLYASLGLGTALLMLSYIDLRTGLLLDIITLPLILAGFGVTILLGASWQLSIAGALIGYGAIAALSWFWRHVRGYEGIGLGDAKLLAAGGAWVGAGLLPVVLLIASGLGIISAFTVSQRTQSRRDQLAIPFGPHLSLGIWSAWCITEMIFP